MLSFSLSFSDSVIIESSHNRKSRGPFAKTDGNVALRPLTGLGKIFLWVFGFLHCCN